MNLATQTVRSRRLAASAALAGCFFIQSRAIADTPAIFLGTGPLGSWEYGPDWSTGVAPNNNGSTTYAVTLPSTGNFEYYSVAQVQHYFAPAYTVDSLSIAQYSEVLITTGSYLSVVADDSASSIGSTIINNGLITVGSTDPTSAADFFVGSSGNQSTTINGSGSVVLSSINVQMYMYGTTTTIGAQQSITGTGHLQTNFGGALAVAGTVDANLASTGSGVTVGGGGSPDALIVSAGTLTNTGTLEATLGGELDLESPVGTLTVDNVAGSLYATQGSAVVLQQTTISGGTIGNSNYVQGIIETPTKSTGGPFNTKPSLLDGKTLGTLSIEDQTTIVINAGQPLALTGTIYNAGTYTINGSVPAGVYSSPDLEIGDGSANDSVTLAGPGTTVLNNLSVINASGGGETLTNSFGHTISGGSFYLQSGGGHGLLNAGTITSATIGDATNTGTIQSSTITGTITNSGGAVDTPNGTVTTLFGTILGGTITAEGSGTVVVPGTDAVLDGTPSAGLTNSGTVVVQSGGQLRLAGTITNNGTIKTDVSLSAPTTISIGAGAGGDVVTLAGNGSLLLTDSSQAVVQGASGTGTETLVNGTQHTIEGSGTFTNLTLTNNGTIIADPGGTITFSNLTNYNPTTQTLTGGTFILQSHMIFDPVQITTLNAKVVLDGPSSGLVNSDGTNALSGLAQIAAGGSLTVENGQTFTTSAPSFSDLGTLTVGDGSSVNFTSLAATGATAYDITVNSDGVSAPEPISVSLLAVLGGDLDVTLLTSLSGSQLTSELAGSDFFVLDAGALQGGFDNAFGGRVNVTDPEGNEMGSFAVTYNTGSNPSVELGAFQSTAVPEPAVGLLLPVVSLLARRKRTRRS